MHYQSLQKAPKLKGCCNTCACNTIPYSPLPYQCTLQYLEGSSVDCKNGILVQTSCTLEVLNHFDPFFTHTERKDLRTIQSKTRPNIMASFNSLYAFDVQLSCWTLGCWSFTSFVEHHEVDPQVLLVCGAAGSGKPVPSCVHNTLHCANRPTAGCTCP